MVRRWSLMSSLQPNVTVSDRPANLKIADTDKALKIERGINFEA